MDLTEFMSLETLAQTLGVNRDQIGRWRRDRGMPAIRLGARTFFHVPAVAAWLKSQETVGSDSGDDSGDGSGSVADDQ